MAPEWTPVQEKQPVPLDLRNAKMGPKGYKERRKRKLEEQEELETVVAVDGMEEDGQDAAVSTGGGKRMKMADGAPYRKVSGKKWKGEAQPASKVMKAPTKRDWDRKMEEKRSKQAFKEHKQQAVEALKAKRQAKSKERRAAKDRKAENQQKSAVVQKITNAATVKKLLKNKKQRKLIKTADTN